MRKRQQTDVAPWLGLLSLVEFVRLAALHNHLGEIVRRGRGLTRNRYRQEAPDQLAVERHRAAGDDDAGPRDLAAERPGEA